MNDRHAHSAAVPQDFAERIRRLRGDLGLTQIALAAQLGVSFATVNRWENGQTRPSPLSWTQIVKLAADRTPGKPTESADELGRSGEAGTPLLDFTAHPEVVSVLAEGERLSFGHLANPAFAAETSKIDPLPHQRIAVYERMLAQHPLRFLLADDAGAGKTIMAGLYIREKKSRRLLRRTLVVAPAGLVGNWRRELSTLFGLSFRIVSGPDARAENPFVGDESNQLIVSVDTLAAARVFGRLQERDVQPYDLVIFDEAHKLSANRGADMRVRKTDRYHLAEALAGVPGRDDRWRLRWSAHHLLLLTATPHMGKDYPYYALWRLLDPAVLSTPEAFAEYGPDLRARHFIRRTKEEMVRLDGRPLYPKRISDTFGYDLTQGDVSEQQLYDRTTDYLRFVYNKARLLNRTAARLAMGVFQRRLASSTYALLRSFERRIVKLDRLIADVQEGRLSVEQLLLLQQRLGDEENALDAETADEETSAHGAEENEISEDRLLQGVVAASLGDLLAERQQVLELLDLAKRVYEKPGTESKFDRLRGVLTDPRWFDEKFIVFTEHRDTLTYLVRRLEGLGYTGHVAQIHGGMDYLDREEQVERFRVPHQEGGCRILVATDAAGEGINLQFCWLMVNWDIPWNPARLEQRMGRIHRYGQKHDPVVILNLIAPGTREGRVLKTLLDKLEAIRKELQSDKVFDVIGRVFQGVSITQYMEQALEEGAEAASNRIEGHLTKEQIEAIAAHEKVLYGTGGDVACELLRLRKGLDHEAYCRLLPGYVQHFIERAAPRVDLAIDGDPSAEFALRPTKAGALDFLLPVLEAYPPAQRDRLTVARPTDTHNGIWVHPGEPLFETFLASVLGRLGAKALRGAVFVDPVAGKPYLFHLARVSVMRQADPDVPELAHEETVECRLVGIQQYEGADIEVCPVEQLLLLRGGRGLPGPAQRFAAAARDLRAEAAAYLTERVARTLALERRDALLADLPERQALVRRGFDFREAELAAVRTKLNEKARAGNKGAQLELARIRTDQREVASLRDHALAVLRREPELLRPGAVEFVAHALVVPSSEPADREQLDADVEAIAVQFARAHEEAHGGDVHDVHTPPLARAAGLPENPGFDLLSDRPTGGKRSIEVKGRAGTGEIEVTGNEWARACNLRDQYWLYVVYDCATPNPRLVRVQDPFGTLLAKAKGSVLIGPAQVQQASAGHEKGQ
jgi:superfamily II DNA or RNA helicase/DNA-binding XRE family transcriptional regulator